MHTSFQDLDYEGMGSIYRKKWSNGWPGLKGLIKGQA